MKIKVGSYFNTVERVCNHDGNETFAIISIQDSAGFGFRFVPERKCKDVLTLKFDDIDTVRKTFRSAENGYEQVKDTGVLFDSVMAEQIVDFVDKNKDEVDEIWIHCYAGVSRSMAVAAALSKFFNGTDEPYFRYGIPNMRVYRETLEALVRRYGWERS